MLLPTMTYKEMYDHLAADLKKVKIKEDYLLSKAVKEFRHVCFLSLIIYLIFFDKYIEFIVSCVQVPKTENSWNLVHSIVVRCFKAIRIGNIVEGFGVGEFFIIKYITPQYTIQKGNVYFEHCLFELNII